MEKEVYTRQEIEEVQNTLTYLVKLIASQPEQDNWRKAVADYRKIDVKYFEDNHCFYVPDIDYIRLLIGEAYYTDTRLGFLSKTGYSPIKERFVIPCYNLKGKVVGLVGYDNTSPNYKYLLSTTLGFQKSNISYGYSDLDFIYDQDYVIFVEGVMEYFRLKSLGYPVYSLQGVNLYPNQKRIFKRLSNQIIMLDTDSAGLSASMTLKKFFPTSTLIQLKREGLSKLDPDTFLSYPENVTYFAFVVNHIKELWQRLDYRNLLLTNQSPELADRMEKAREQLKKLEMEEIRNETN